MNERERLAAEIEQLTADVSRKLEALEDEAAEVKERVRRAFSLDHQVQERPWTVFAACALAGLVLARWLR